MTPAPAATWVLPSWRDPRVPFAAVLTLYGVIGFSWLGFNRSPWQMLTVVASGTVLDMALAWGLRRQRLVPLSSYISCCSLALLLNYSHASWVLLLPVLLTIGSKYVLTHDGKHVFNPSMFGVSMSLLIGGELITAAPAYQWAGGSVTMSAFMVTAALALFVVRIGRNWLILSFLGFYALQTGLRAYFMRHHIPPEMLFLGTLTAPPFFLFTFYMLTDPATSPKTPRGQVLFALAIAVLDLLLHTMESVFTFFYAALIMGTGKFVFLHARSIHRTGVRRYLADRLTWDTWRPMLAVGALAVAMLGTWRFAIRPTPADAFDPGFTMVKLSPDQTGIHTEMSDLLERVDPRIAHVAKWIISIGDAVAVGDYDGDGRLDLFLTNLLKRPEDRHALYRNLGGMKFERVPVPALDHFRRNYTVTGVGLPAGATFVDYDGDGDQDLAIAVGFGRSRLLRNQLAETGRAALIDVSDQVGLDRHTVSLAISFLDYDRDGVLDMYVANSIDPLLRDYDPPRPLNVFELPAPEHDGDRRMLRFMHDGWHNAENGGPNTLYRGRRDGTFDPIDADAIGMPETHWSLAVSTADFDHDGYTDLYVANDFGPDDLYLNRGGRKFERIVGRLFGDVGKDTYKGMNASVADFDRNGWLDVYVSNVHHSLQAEGSLLWMVRPSDDPRRPAFSDEATRRGALNERRFGWGAAAGDLDNDGWTDIVQANGMVDDRLDSMGYRNKDYWYVNHKLMQSGPELHTYADMWGDIRGREIYPNEPRRAYLNRGGSFVDVARRIGIDDPDNSRGVAMADFDDDGDLDLVITNQHGPVSIYRNQPAVPRSWIGLALVGNGTATHRTAIGTRVVLRVPGAGTQTAEVGTLGGFSAQGDPRLHFGLGDHRGAVEVDIHWYGGKTQTLTLEPGRYHTLEQPP